MHFPSVLLTARTPFVMDREVAVILDADVVDYAALIERDQTGRVTTTSPNGPLAECAYITRVPGKGTT